MANVGTLLMGRYRLDAVVGSGAMSTVFRAWDMRLHRRVAVKVLASNLAAEPDVARRFEAEARHLGAVSHPNLVTVFDVGDERSEPFYVMELVEGETLEKRLLRFGTLSPTDTAAIVAQVAKAVDLLHARSLVHRDVKPGNVLLSEGGMAQLADFGLVREDRTGEATVPGVVAGTLGYLAPEVIRGEPATAASDVYALAALAYRALTGSLPYPAGTIAELVEAQAAPARPVSGIRPGLGEGMDAALASALGPAAARPTAGELAAHLNLALATMDPAALWVPAGAGVASAAAAAAAAAGVVAAGAGAAGAGAAGAGAAGAGAAGASAAARAVAEESTRTMGTAPGLPRTGQPSTGGGSLARRPAVLAATVALLLLAAFAVAGFSLPGFLVPPPVSTDPAALVLNAIAATPVPSFLSGAPRTSPSPTLPPSQPPAKPIPSASPPPSVRPTPTPTPKHEDKPRDHRHGHHHDRPPHHGHGDGGDHHGHGD